MARSPGLTDAFIKEKIHPYCTYSSPAPRVQTVVHYPCGRMLLGQAAYVPEDFTGRRSTFFSHNYVIPPAIAGLLLEDMAGLLTTRFETSYDISLDGVLEPLEFLPRDTHLCTGSLLPQVEEGIISKIAECVCESVQASKKTYVLVPDSTGDMFEFVRGVLISLYQRLPEWVKHQLGFCTFAREPDKRKGIHLVFLVQPFLRPTDSCFAGDFIIHISNEDENNNRDVTAVSGVFGAFLDSRIQAFTIGRFFTEMDFWRVRLPSYCDIISKTERNWLDKKLDSLTLSQLREIPQKFIKRGLADDDFSIYVMLSILKTAVTDFNTDPRYLLGSYFLSPANYDRIAKNLRRLEGAI